MLSVANRAVCHVALVISSEVENGASGTSDMDGCAARVAARESGDEQVKSLDVSLNEPSIFWRQPKVAVGSERIS